MARSANPRRTGFGAANLDTKGRVNRFIHKTQTRQLVRNMAKRIGGGSVY